MYWSIVLVLVLLVLIVLPPYAYFVAKYAGAGWIAGIRSFLRNRGER